MTRTWMILAALVLAPACSGGSGGSGDDDDDDDDDVSFDYRDICQAQEACEGDDTIHYCLDGWDYLVDEAEEIGCTTSLNRLGNCYIAEAECIGGEISTGSQCDDASEAYNDCYMENRVPNDTDGDTGRRRSASKRIAAPAPTAVPHLLQAAIACEESTGTGEVPVAVVAAHASVPRGHSAVVDLVAVRDGVTHTESHRLEPSRDTRSHTTFHATLSGGSYVPGQATALACDSDLTVALRVYQGPDALWDCFVEGPASTELLTGELPHHGTRIQADDLSGATCAPVQITP